MCIVVGEEAGMENNEVVIIVGLVQNVFDRDFCSFAHLRENQTKNPERDNDDGRTRLYPPGRT